MKLFYYCFAGSHSSIIAANIHLKRLPSDGIPEIKEIMKVSGFDGKNKKQLGVPLYLGQDEAGNEVYAMGLGKDRKLGLQVIYRLLEERANPTEWRFFDSLSEINLLTKIGGFMSGNLNMINLGKYLAALGIQRSYRELCDLVGTVKEWSTDCPEKL